MRTRQRGGRLALAPRVRRRPPREHELWFTPPLPGWPGWRTRRGRSGLDWIDTQTEAAHAQGVFLSKVLRGRLKTRSLPGLILLGLGGLLGVLLLCPLIAAPVSALDDIQSLIILSPFLVYGYIGVVLLINFFINLRELMNPPFTILNLESDDPEAIEQCALLLVEGFKEHWPDSWPDVESARGEVREMLAEGRICRIAVDQAGNVVGWVGGIPQYDGNVWELHPMVVKPDQQQQGIGRALVKDFEAQVRKRGGLTIMLGTDDEDGMTTLSNVNLYEDTWEIGRASCRER